MQDLNEIEQELLQLCIDLNVIPSKENVKDLFGKSYSSLLRLGVSLLRIRKYLPRKNKKICLNCGNEILSKSGKKFCSRSCSATYSNKNSDLKYINRKVNTLIKKENLDISNLDIESIRNIVNTKIEKIKSTNKVEKYCLYCNKPIRKKNTYCSIRCQQDYKYNQFITGWLNGEIDAAETSKSVPNRVRKYLFTLYDSKCARCGWGEINPITGNSPLEVEHIDGDSSNNKVENLTLLCPNCHSLTPTYKALNKGNGRHSRRIRYKEGKSY